MEDDVPTSAGLSSFNLLDEEKFFACLGIKPGMTMLDLACGLGNYAIASSPYIGDAGRIHAIDLWEEGIETLNVRTSIGNISNIRTWLGDAAKPLPLEDQCADICLMATVVHILKREGKLARTMQEVQRILKPEGTIAVVEFEKIDVAPGPPVSIRIAPDELAGVMSPFGFKCDNSTKVGPYNYLSRFSRQQVGDGR